MANDDASDETDAFLTDEQIRLLFPECARPSLRTIRRYRLEEGLSHYRFRGTPVTKRSVVLEFIEQHLKVDSNRTRKRSRRW